MDEVLQKPCRTCQLDAIQGSLVGDYPELNPLKPWKFGILFVCSNCGRHWFLHEHRKQISRIQDDLLPLAQFWNHHQLFLGADLLALLAAIGGVSDYHLDKIEVPCSVGQPSGKSFEKAIVLISKSPPHFWCEPSQVYWADDIATLEPTPYALPLDVRAATAKKRDDSFGFAPVGIIDGQGNEYTLSGKSTFFHWRGVLGKDISLSRRYRNWPKRAPAEPADAYFFIDWFDGCEELLLRGRC